MSGGCIPAVLLHEDGSKAAHTTLVRLIRKMLRQVHSSFETQRFVPLPAEDNARAVMRANNWKAGGIGGDSKLRRMCQFIATQLLQERFVFVHFDGDRRWAERHTNENLSKWAKTVVPMVRLYLEATRPDAVERLMGRLFPLVSFYSVEAWTYQHTELASKLCCGQHLQQIQGWLHDRAQLDEIAMPKKANCLTDQHNSVLAGAGFPSDAVLEVGKSWFYAVRTLRECADLREALRPAWERGGA